MNEERPDLAETQLPPHCEPRHADGGPAKHELELRNFVALTRDLGEQRLVFESRPYYLEYSTNSACNLRCIMCSQVENPPVVSTPLPAQEPLLEELFRYATLWTPSATSEPLLNNFSRLWPLIEKYRIQLDIITNAMLLDEEILEKMLPQLHRLTLSIDSHEKAVFEKLRAPAVFETVVENSRRAIVRCREVGIPVVFHMVLAIDGLESLEEYVDFVAELGGTHITVLELLENSHEFAELDPFSKVGEAHVAARLDAMRERARQRGVSLVYEVHAPLGGQWNHGSSDVRVSSGGVMELMHSELAVQNAGFCPMVGNYLKVEPDGRTYPCCRAPQELELGNVLEAGVEAVWNGKPMQELRRRMYAKDYPEPCQGCVVLEAPKWTDRDRRATPESRGPRDGNA